MTAEQFNEKYKVGHLGFLHKDDGTVEPTTVREPAFEIEGGRVVAFFENVRGYYLAERFVPLR